MLKWLIIGGGVHGVHLACVLDATRRQDCPRDRIAILDPHPSLLERWRRAAANVGMAYLRSPRVHHLDKASNSLHAYAVTHRGEAGIKYAPPYNRPSLDLFDRHCREVIASRRLDKRLLHGMARRVRALPDGLRVETDNGDIAAERIVVCTGPGEHAAWPEWATTLKTNGGDVRHCLEERLPGTFAHRDVCVLGGGISAVQTALRLAAGTTAAVALISRHDIRVHQFDSDPGWIGPKYLSAFHRTNDLRVRRRMIDNARHRGSIPPDICAALTTAVRSGRIQHYIARVTNSRITVNGRIRLVLAATTTGDEPEAVQNHAGHVADDHAIDAATILLATGHNRSRPGGDLIDHMVADFGLPCAPCGFPLPKADLRWHHPRIYLSGALAELEIGPVARNIVGARLAGRRIAPG